MERVLAARADRADRPKLKASALTVVVSVSLLILIGLHVDGNHASGAERLVFRVINGLPSLIYRPAWIIMQLGNMLAVPALAILALILRRYRLAIAFLIVGLGKWGTSRLLKDVFLRERPASILPDVVIRDAPVAGQAFVSGHAVIAVGLAVVLHPYIGRRGRIIVWVAASLVCVARVYVGAHLPLDVVGGACAGWVIGSVANILAGFGGRPTTRNLPHLDPVPQPTNFGGLSKGSSP